MAAYGYSVRQGIEPNAEGVNIKGARPRGVFPGKTHQAC